MFQHIRKITEDILASFSNELNQQSWDNVLNINDVNQAYDNFLHIIFIVMFKKHCPVKRVSRKGYTNNKPWFTKGLKCATNKHNTKCFILCHLCHS